MESTFENLLKRIDKALDYGDNAEIHLCIIEAQKYLTLLTNNEDLLECHWVLYRLYFFINEYEISLNHLQEALQLTTDSQKTCMLYLEQGTCYMCMAQDEKGLDTFQKALDVAKTSKDYYGSAMACNLIGRYYYLKADWIKSLEYFNETKKYAHNIHNFNLESEALIQIGSIFYKEERINLALETFREAEEIAVDCHNHYLIYRAAIKRCKIYLDKNQMEQVKLIINNLHHIDDPLETNCNEK